MTATLFDALDRFEAKYRGSAQSGAAAELVAELRSVLRAAAPAAAPVVDLGAKLAQAEYVIGAFERGADPADYARDIAEFRATDAQAAGTQQTTGSPAAPAPVPEKTLLDEFAMAALPGLMGRVWADPVTGQLPPDIFNTWVTSAFAIAAEMLAARTSHLTSER